MDDPPEFELATGLFNLLTPKLTISCPCSVDRLCAIFASKSVHSFSKYHIHKFL